MKCGGFIDAPLALRAVPPSGSEPAFGRPCVGLIGFLRMLAAACLLSGCQAAQTQQTVGVIATHSARCADAGRQGANGVAFLSDADWQEHLAVMGGSVRTAVSSWQVDFPAGQSVILLSAGPLPNPGYRVSVRQSSLPVRDQTLYVKAAVEPPPGDRIQAQVIAFPCVYLQLDAAQYREIEVQVE